MVIKISIWVWQTSSKAFTALSPKFHIKSLINNLFLLQRAENLTCPTEMDQVAGMKNNYKK